jgi:uncharacterized protein YjiK/2',3'-cyclic-nucleotide 2'-phosphodiesterase (5'-nucleotidase family)
MKFRPSFSATVLALAASVSSLQAQLLVTEINSNGSGGDFWELTNVGTTSVDISGYKWNDNQRSFTGTTAVTIPANTLINAGESIIFNEVGTATVFRTAWGLAATVKVIPGGPGLAMNDAITLYNSAGTELFYLTYAANGFTRTSGTASAGGHAGVSAGGAATVSMVWDQASTTSPRYSAAMVGNLGSFAHSTSPTTIGSPGFNGIAVAPPSVTLSVSATPSTFAESAANPASVGTVTRAVATASDLVVNLSSNDLTEASFPTQVTILANQTSANFNITAVNDSFPDGTKSVIITASAADASTGLATLTVTDDGDVVTSNLMLTEILSNQSNPNTAGSVGDYWELTNFGSTSVDLSGYSWHDEGRAGSAAASYALPAGSAISAGESVIFTVVDPTIFRAWWNLAPSVQVFRTVGAPGLGSGDGVSFFDNSGNEMFFFSYAANGFTREDGSPSTTGHAGAAAGASADTIALIWVPTSPTTVTTGTAGTLPPRYTFATGSNFGSRLAATSADLGSPGTTVGVPAVNIANAAVAEGNSGTSTLALTVTRTDLAAAFTVDYTVTGGTANSTDFTLASGTLSFTAAGAASLPINITVNGDTTTEPNETVIVTLSNLINTTGTTVIGTAVGTATITNDDVVLPTFTTAPVSTSITSGGVATLTLVAGGSPAPTIQWYQGNSGDTSTPVGTNSPIFTTPSLNATTNYWARISNTGGPVDSSTITVTVASGATAIDLSTYVRVGRFGLPEPTRTPLPAGTASHNLLCQEASAVTYNWDTDTLFISCDGGRSVTQVSKTGQLIDTMSLDLQTGAPQGTAFYDPEGITYIGGGQFVMSEERDQQLVKFTYVAGTTLTRANSQTVDLGPFDDNTGTEGLSWDPPSSDFICLKEKAPIGVFRTSVNFTAGTSSIAPPSVGNEASNLFNTSLLGMTDVADVFAFSNIPSMVGQPQADNLLIVGQENARIVNISRSGSILSTLNLTADVGDAISAADMQHEGITMDRVGNIYVVNENGGGNINFPQLWVYAASSATNLAPTSVAINNPLNSIQENSSTASPVKVGDIVVSDDGLGSNTLSLTGADAASFEITGSSLFLKAGVTLDFETKTSYAVTINADDTTLGATPDTTVNFTLTVTDQVVETPAPPALIVTEVAPWSSGNSPVILADWFEVTNVSASPVNITGWKVDDSSALFTSALTLNGITTIAPGESVIFLESSATNLPATVIANFKSVWFGSSVPVGLQVGTYQGSGIGLGTGGDAVNLYNASGVKHSGVSFGAADATSPYQTFDNTAAVNDAVLTLLSTTGVNGAFTATNTTEIGSPGFSAPGVLRVTEIAPWSSGNSPVAADWFEVTNTGARAVDLTGWKFDDSSESPSAALPLTGITRIAPGESVIFIETSATQTASGNAAAFRSNWFGTTPPVALQVGAYTGGGAGLSTSGDAVNLFDSNNVRQANVSFGIATSAAPYRTFDNAAAANVASITTFSTAGINGAFAAVNSSTEIGSPGTLASAPIGASAVSIDSAAVNEGNSGSTTLNLPVTRTNTASVFTVAYAVTGGTATSGSDFTLASGTLTFDFNGAATQNIAITINGDTTIESSETVIVTLSNIVNSNGSTTLGTAAGTGTITNDDTVPVSFPSNGKITASVKGSIDLDAPPLASTNGAEIPAFDPVSKRAFTSSNSGIQVINLTNPAAPAFITTIAPASLGVAGLTSNDVSSITVRKAAGGNPSVLAAAIISSPKSALGYVVFLNPDTGALLGSTQVGANPDHIAFSPDGTKLLVANEGELDAVNAAPTVIAADTTVGSVSIISVPASLTGMPTSLPTATADFTSFDSQAAALSAAGVRIFQGGKPSTDFEPEYFAISADSTKAMVTLQEANAVATLDIASATFTSVVPLGKKNFASGRYDFSDRDGAAAANLINPTTGNPVYGMYMPDAVASYSAAGQSYYITSNEGDDRNDFLNPDETTTVGNAGYVLDPTVFPNAAALKNQASLGRLTVCNSPGLRGDTDNDGDIDEILSYGGRSFSILDATGAIIWDSGDMIENIIASQFPANFDDTRSDNKGPEPEGVTIATLGARTYAFIGLERSHMTLMFDVTNPAAVTFAGGLVRSGDLNPEGLVVVSAADSPTGKPLLLVASEVSQSLTVFELNQTTDYTLQVLHYYGESGLLGIQTAPIMGAMIDKFDDLYTNTVVIGEGDSYIPGPWLIAGADPVFNNLLHTTAQVYTGNSGTLGVAGTFNTTATATSAVPFGRADIAIMNAFGTTVSALGNHEFDLGSPVLASAIYPATTTGSSAVGNWVGAKFPHITANLNFAGDSSLRPRADTSVGGSGTNAPNVNAITEGSIANLEVTSINMQAKIAPYAIKTINGQRIGFVGATNWDLLSKTSPNGTLPKDDANAATSDLQEVAAYLQGAVNSLQALGVTKIIQVDQLDDLQRNKDLAPLVTGIDIVVAGGGHERMGDSTDVPVGFNGHDADFIADAYPITTVGADGKPVLIVTTDTEYTYLGRLVADFDADGVLILPNLNPALNGAYASTEANLQAAYATTDSAATIVASSSIGSQVKTIVDAINNVVVTKDGNVYGYTQVYLEGDRVFGRTQEVNLGNITADANALKARTALGLGLGDAVFSLKNGGGIRASLGSVLANGSKVAPIANPLTSKPAGGISQLDVENALRFDNKLMVFDATPLGLKNILEFASGLSSGPTAQNGGYPQVGNIRFSYDFTQPAGSRLRSAALVNEAGQIVAKIVEDGAVLTTAPATIKCVALSFTANGGDSYPIKYLNPPTNTTVNPETSNFQLLLTNGGLSAPVARNLDFTAASTYTSLGLTAADVLGEQKAFQDFLAARHPSLATAYNTADTSVALDTRIQQKVFRLDTVLDGPLVLTAWLKDNGLTSTTLDTDNDSLTDLQEFAFGLDPRSNDNAPVVTDVPGGVLTTRGTPAIYTAPTTSGQDFRVVFIRQKSAAASGITYIPEFSADMITWEASNVIPTTIASDSEVEAVSIRYPFFVNGKKARFFRVGVSQN